MMIELIRTNDAVILSVASSLMKEAGIAHFVTDTHTSVLEGSMGFIQRRLLVDEACEQEARTILKDAGLAQELRD